MKSTFTFTLVLLIPLSFSTGLAFAQRGSKEDEATKLAKKVQNPVSDLISLPLAWGISKYPFFSRLQNQVSSCGVLAQY